MPITSADLQFEYYIVCVLDLLNQQEKLKGWSKLPSATSPDPNFIKAVKETVGTVNWFRQAFVDFFHQADQVNLSPQQLSNLSEQGLEQFRRYRECALKTLHFSDTFVFYAPLRNSHGDYSLSALYRIITACSMAMLVALAAKVPVRGGIAIGTGTVLDDGDFYGPALARAHHLESKEARYPRILVDEEVLQILGNRFSSDNITDKISHALARECEFFICRGSDQKWMVDFLGKAARKMAQGGIVKMEVVESVAAFVQREYDSFKDVGNEKLQSRYKLLLDYVTERLPIWR